MTHLPTRGFTLVELLVVISIIVILLALLTPAMEKALYTAELTVCGANLKSVGLGAITYAMGSRKNYPYRRMVHEKENVQPGQLTYPDQRTALDNFDLRPLFSTFSSLEAYKCPLSGGFDVDTDDPNAFIYSNYNLFFGWQQIPTDGAKQPGLKKIGEKWGWGSDRFTVLAVDQDVISFAFGAYNAWSSHPDINRTSTFDELNGVDSAAFTLGGNPTGRYYTSKWGGPRGPMDMNVVFTDGSAHRQQYKGVSSRAIVGRSPHYNSTPRNSNNPAQNAQGANPSEPTNGTWNTIPLR